MLHPRQLDAARQWRAVILESRGPSGEPALLSLLRATPDATLDLLLGGKAFSPLIGACIADNPWLVSRLVSLGASTAFPDDGGWTALHWCCKSNRPACALALLEAGADPNATHASEPSSCLHFCAQSSAVQCARLLLAHGADPESIDSSTGASPRHWAAHDPELSLLMGSTLPGPDLFGRTALHWAVRQAGNDRQALGACRMWVDLGSNALSRDLAGHAPIDLALRRGLVDCSAYLESLRERSALEGLLFDRPSLHAPTFGRFPPSL